MPVFRKNNLLLFLLFILASGCHNTYKNDNSEDSNRLNNSALRIYSSCIHSIKLPFKDTCDDTISIQRLTLPDSLSKFKKYGQLIGKVTETKKYIAILYAIAADVQLPVLHTFSRDGKEISSLNLFIGNCCGENEACSGLSTVQITKDLRIILKDSTQSFERDKRNSDKKQSIKLLKKQEEFKIDSTGNIIQINRHPGAL